LFSSFADEYGPGETGRGSGDPVAAAVPVRIWRRRKSLASAYSSTEEVTFLPITIY